MLLFVVLYACAPCKLESSFNWYTPACDQAVLKRYSNETRLVIPGTSASLLAYLPHDVHIDKYGGITGNYLLIILDQDLALSPQSYLTIEYFDSTQITGYLNAIFENGSVVGDFVATYQKED